MKTNEINHALKLGGLTTREVNVAVAIARYYAAFKAANGRDADFKIEQRGVYFYRRNAVGRLEPHPWHGLTRLIGACIILEARNPVRTTFGTAKEVLEAINVACERELADDHLTPDERKNIVGGVRVFFPKINVKDMSLDTAFVYVIFDAELD